MTITSPERRHRGSGALVGLVVFVAAVAAAALVGVLLSPDTAQEYARLEAPDWAPPSWLFGPVWTTLYAMIALAGWLVWRRFGWKGARLALSLFALQLLLNAAWSPLFFTLGLRGTAFADIVVLWVVLCATIALFARLSRPAAWLLVPYWAWTTFATLLSFTMWRLNAGG
ncbi:TspO/MBR family protein [Nocardiopsis aegyptia]|uniref:Tryptophan-rich sensory protein n=1 Tax=Nocardiopsis aegyptia TaxID=220378 RepID=A0A7Z0EMV5_9ACTN|nr:TspO/MBR family protein [Nocardiopsis aegyptia]NYJ35048.1 tryptophan-rich sensory protein [Nocardiopsis aegyptia]